MEAPDINQTMSDIGNRINAARHTFTDFSAEHFEEIKQRYQQTLDNHNENLEMLNAAHDYFMVIFETVLESIEQAQVSIGKLLGYKPEEDQNTNQDETQPDTQAKTPEDNAVSQFKEFSTNLQNNTQHVLNEVHHDFQQQQLQQSLTQRTLFNESFHAAESSMMKTLGDLLITMNNLIVQFSNQTASLKNPPGKHASTKDNNSEQLIIE